MDLVCGALCAWHACVTVCTCIAFTVLRVCMCVHCAGDAFHAGVLLWACHVRCVNGAALRADDHHDHLPLAGEHAYLYQCRCGDVYALPQQDLAAYQCEAAVPCHGCSNYILVTLPPQQSEAQQQEGNGTGDVLQVDGRAG